MEDIVAAAQEMGPDGDTKTLEALMIRISREMMCQLRRMIWKHHPNHGNDMIEQVHAQLIEAILRLDSADGKGLRVATGYNQRSRIETQSGRWKGVIGPKLKSRSFSRQITEIKVGQKVLNTMTALGRPVFERIA